jgi:polyferredoxin
MSRRKVLYWTAVVLLLAATFLPYVWTRLTGFKLSSVVGDFGSAALWLILLLVILFHFTEYRGLRRWWPTITAPIALFPTATTIFTFIVWKLRGFAP